MMRTDIGEYIVGAYLKIIEGCDFVDYNVRFPGGGLRGLRELDVIGLDFKRQVAFLCEATTHIRGVLYKDNRTTVERIATKHRTQIEYAMEHLQQFQKRHYMFWSPVVPVGYITKGLEEIPDLELVINKEYTRRIELLRSQARNLTHDAGNPFFRTLQVLEHLRR